MIMGNDAMASTFISLRFGVGGPKHCHLVTNPLFVLKQLFAFSLSGSSLSVFVFLSGLYCL